MGTVTLILVLFGLFSALMIGGGAGMMLGLAVARADRAMESGRESGGMEAWLNGFWDHIKDGEGIHWGISLHKCKDEGDDGDWSAPEEPDPEAMRPWDRSAN